LAIFNKKVLKFHEINAKPSSIGNKKTFQIRIKEKSLPEPFSNKKTKPALGSLGAKNQLISSHFGQDPQ